MTTPCSGEDQPQAKGGPIFPSFPLKPLKPVTTAVQGGGRAIGISETNVLSGMDQYKMWGYDTHHASPHSLGSNFLHFWSDPFKLSEEKLSMFEASSSSGQIPSHQLLSSPSLFLVWKGRQSSSTSFTLLGHPSPPAVLHQHLLGWAGWICWEATSELLV